MIDEIQKIIAQQLKEKNKYLNRIDVNCIQMDSGHVVLDFNRNEVYSGASDIVGVGAYIRYTTRFQYSPVTPNERKNKRTSSCNNQHAVEVPLRMVIYNFDDSKEFNITRLEEKITNDIMGVSFSSYNGAETQISIEITDSVNNPHDVWQSEIQMPVKEGNNFFQMLAINFNLTFVRSFMKEDCFEDCFVFNNDTKC